MIIENFHTNSSKMKFRENLYNARLGVASFAYSGVIWCVMTVTDDLSVFAI